MSRITEDEDDIYAPEEEGGEDQYESGNVVIVSEIEGMASPELASRVAASTALDGCVEIKWLQEKAVTGHLPDVINGASKLLV